jgi:predicted aldo/keto reductase-like oxidoreductase
MLPFIIEQKFDVVQIPYNFALGTRRDPFNMDATGLEAALDRLKKAGMGVVAMKVMAGGYREARLKNPNADIHTRAGARQAAIRWALRDERIQSTSVRMVDADQLEENLRAMNVPFTEADRRLLGAYTDAITPVYCRMCGACDGACPKGMPVSDVVRFVMYAEAYGQYELGRGRFAGAIGRVRCRECGKCSVVCPNAVAVRERMNRANELFC